ncbi:hypothetical protein F4810DRAFT_678377 [Camillea tinctor]|nr:hypothetical protein F4810DRAFT_678377 [Camillea tinctor]
MYSAKLGLVLMDRDSVLAMMPSFFLLFLFFPFPPFSFFLLPLQFLFLVISSSASPCTLMCVPYFNSLSPSPAPTVPRRVCP